MESNLQSMSTEELRAIAVNFTQHRGMLVAAAKQELANRGEVLSEEELRSIAEQKEARKRYARESQEASKGSGWFKNTWKQNIVQDEDAPQLYSRRAIYGFSIALSVMFGGILLAINLNKLGNKKAILPVLLYSFVYTTAMILVMQVIPFRASGLPLIANLLGAIPLYNYFWWKQVGREVEYRAKPIWIPLIISILLSAFFIFCAIVGAE